MVMLTGAPETMAKPDRDWAWWRMSSAFGYEMGRKFCKAVLLRWSVVKSETRVLASLTGMGLKNTAFTTVNIAVFAPMPSASVRTATAVKAGDLRMVRRVKR